MLGVNPPNNNDKKLIKNRSHKRTQSIFLPNENDELVTNIEDQYGEQSGGVKVGHKNQEESDDENNLEDVELKEEMFNRPVKINTTSNNHKKSQSLTYTNHSYNGSSKNSGK